MDSWADSMGVAVSHRPAPAKYHAPAAPQGEVLAVTVTITDKAQPKDRLAINVANWGATQYATDWVEAARDRMSIPCSHKTPCFHRSTASPYRWERSV
jgi:hypothetical protein